MLAVLGLITPLFGVIVLRFALGQSGYLTRGADRFLAEFGFKIAMPAYYSGPSAPSRRSPPRRSRSLAPTFLRVRPCGWS